MAGKHTDEQLKDMAETVLEEEGTPSGRPLRLYLTIAQRTGIAPMEVRQRIIEMARGPLHATT